MLEKYAIFAEEILLKSIMIEYIAKENGITLKEHTYKVIKQVETILTNAGITDDNIIKLSKVAAAIHDCGKTAKSFQKYIKNPNVLNDETEFYRHNEIAFGLIDLIVDKNYGIFNNNLSDLVKFVSLYHHAPYNMTPCHLNTLYSLDEIHDISAYYNELFKECEINDIVLFRVDIDEDEFDECGILVGNVNTFRFINSEDTTDSMLKLKYFEIIFNVVRYSDLIASGENSFNTQRYNWNITHKSFVFPSYYDKDRWNEQCEVADKAFDSNITLLSATMGWGKTFSGANFLLHSTERGFWVCPDNSLAISTYESLVRTLKECGVSNVRIALLLSGNWVENNWGGQDIKISDCDIIVTNIDTYVNGLTRNARKEISYEALFSNCIFDEYHEYAFTTSPLLSRFLTIINARKMMNKKTLLLSGTAINKGYINVENVIEAGLKQEAAKKVKICFLSAKDYYSHYLNTPNSIHIFSRIETSQNNFENCEMDLCYHSLFDDEDSKTQIKTILSHNGKNSKLTPLTLSSTPVCSRGMDMSFQNGFLINPTPHMIEQLIGRLGRWDISIVGTLYIVIDDRKSELFIYQETKAWENYYSKYIEHLKAQISDVPISLYDLRNIRVNFFENNTDKNISYKKFIRNNLIQSLNLLSQIQFTKGSSIGGKATDAKHIKDGVDIRGNTMSRFFAVQKDDKPFGTLSGPINIQSYRFGGNDFNRLRNNGDIIRNIIKYFKKNPDIATKYGIKDISKRKPDKLYEYLMIKAKCSDTPFPLLCNYGYNSKIGFHNEY